MREIDAIVIHCSAGSQKQTAADIVRYHTGKGRNCLGWSAPGYHFVVEADGSVVPTLPVERVSNGVRGHNRHIVNVCWVGGVDTSLPGMPAVDNRTPEQKEALAGLLVQLRALFPKARIMGHRDFSDDRNGNGVIDPWERIKECPCFDAIPEYAGI